MAYEETTEAVGRAYQAETTDKRNTVHMANSTLNASLDELTETVNKLLDNLHPVLRASDVPTGILSLAKSDEISPIQGFVVTMTETVNTLQQRIAAALSRLDI
jgi:hypothetical protein